MDRRKTILIAVVINIGLLCLLLIAAIDFQGTDQLLQGNLLKEDVSQRMPLFPEENDLALGAPLSSTIAAVEKEALPLPLPMAESAEIVHKLPSIETREVIKPVVSTPSTPLIKNTLEIAVKKGDTLEKIARLYHTTVDQIIQLNQLPSSFLRVGQQLKIPIEKKRDQSRSVAKSMGVEKNAKAEHYTVKVGDNPWTIAMKHHMKVEDLLKMNQLNEEKARKLKPGDRLRIR